jgi:hypothetical protein
MATITPSAHLVLILFIVFSMLLSLVKRGNQKARRQRVPKHPTTVSSCNQSEDSPDDGLLPSDWFYDHTFAMYTCT